MQNSTTSSKKITLATIKSFLKKNTDIHFINVETKFDGMTDSCEPRNDGFTKAVKTTNFIENSLGIKGAYFVVDGRDYFRPFENENLKGYCIYNSCGSFKIAISK